MGSTYSTRTLVIIAVIVAAIAFTGGYFIKGDTDDEETPTPTPVVVTSYTPLVTGINSGQIYTVRLTPTGLSPAVLSIRAGDSVTIRNETPASFWPASNPHPTHKDCPGFDALRGLGNGESYTLTFTKAQVCGYHNHLDPANSTMKGTITVR